MSNEKICTIRHFIALSAAVVVAFAIFGEAARAEGAEDCRQVEGHLTEQAINPSPLQTVGAIKGSLSGDYSLTVTSAFPSTTPNVLLFNGSSSIHTSRGDLNLTEAGVVDQVTEAITEIWTVQSGTGSYANASGQIFATGNFSFVTGKGAGIIRGEICTP